jgi:hypothetical protein
MTLRRVSLATLSDPILEPNIEWRSTMTNADELEDLIAALPADAQENARTILHYNAEIDGRRAAKNTFAQKSLADIQADQGYLEHLNRDIERQGIPKKSDGVDKDGRQQWAESDPRDAVRARIAKKKAERDKRMAEVLPREIDLLPWLKRNRGKTLTAIPTPKPISSGANLAELFDENCAAHDAARLRFKRILTAKLPKSEALANARAYVAAMAEKSAPSVYEFFASGRFGPRGTYEPLRGIARPEFVTDTIGWDHGNPITVVPAPDLMAAVVPDQFLGMFEKLIESRADDPEAIPAAERPARLAKAADKVLAAMRAEATSGLACVRARVPVSLRQICNPACWLGVGLSADDAVRWEG